MKPLPNTLFTEDNLFVLHGLNSGIADLIYLDPPFNSKRTYSAPIGSRAAGAAFKDMWSWADVNEAYLEGIVARSPGLVKIIEAAQFTHSKDMAAYLTYMAQRIIEMHRVLKDTGSLYLHCDPTASHYLKIVLDEVFGKNHFHNEIIWCYSGGGRSASDFAQKHDVIFRYAKSEKFIFNADPVRVPYNLDAEKRTSPKAWGSHGGDKIYAPNPKGKVPEDWWVISPINSQSAERTGYPTQKPLALLRRIIEASSNEGDLVLDPFCGCATTCVAAQQLGRRWIGIDIEKQAASVLVQRLSDASGLFKDFIHRTDVPRRSDIAEEPITPSTKQRLFSQQSGHCNGCGAEFEARNLEVDHIIPRAKGGGDYFENYQLLCGSCNRVKGDRPMEYLRMRIRTLEAGRAQISFGN